MLNDKAKLVALREDINKALADVAESYGVEIQAGDARYASDGFSCTFKLEVELKETADGEDVARLKFEENARYFNIDPADYGVVFGLQGKEFRLVGFNPRARKNSLIIESTSGDKQYAIDPETYLTIRGMQKVLDAAAA